MSKSSRDLRSENGYCKYSIACDAAPLNLARREKGICPRCEEKQKKKGAPTVLKGENTALYTYRPK